MTNPEIHGQGFLTACLHSLNKKQEQETRRHFSLNHIISMFTAYSAITAVTTESSEGHALSWFAGHHSFLMPIVIS